MAIILTIEDETQIRENLVRFISLEGHAAIAACDGIAGLEAARAHRPELIFCDVMMPRMGGFEVLAAIKQDPNLQHIPFYFLSASAESESLEAGLRLGAVGYVVKPFKLGEMRSLLNKHFGHSVGTRNSHDDKPTL